MGTIFNNGSIAMTRFDECTRMRFRMIFRFLTLAIVTSFLSQKALADEFKPRTVIRRPFPTITKFPILKAKEADSKIGGAELVLGVVVNKQARAYPINMLTGPRREILNDLLGGKAIAATW